MAAPKLAKLTAPSGATVEVDEGRVDNLVRYGFTKGEAKKESAKKAASSSDKK